MVAEVQSVRAEAQAQRESIVALNERERTLRQTMAEREQTLQQAMTERDRQLGSLQEAMAQRDRQLGSLQEMIAHRDRQLGMVQANLTSAQARLKSIRSSISWKVTGPLREMRRAAVRFFGLFRRRKPAALAVVALGNSETEMPDEIASGLTEPARLLYRNLRDAAAVQRGIEEKSRSTEERI
jgi:hypothetical protein